MNINYVNYKLRKHIRRQMGFKKPWSAKKLLFCQESSFVLISAAGHTSVFIPVVPGWGPWVGWRLWCSGGTAGSWWSRFPGQERPALISSAASASPPPSSPWPPDAPRPHPTDLCLTPDLCCDPPVSSLGSAALRCERAAPQVNEERTQMHLRMSDCLEQVNYCEDTGTKTHITLLNFREHIAYRLAQRYRH